MVASRPQSALPSVSARIVAVLVIMLAGLLGGVLGYQLVRVQCAGECAVPLGIGILLGSVSTALGMAVVVVLALRAMGEWSTTR